MGNTGKVSKLIALGTMSTTAGQPGVRARLLSSSKRKQYVRIYIYIYGHTHILSLLLFKYSNSEFAHTHSPNVIYTIIYMYILSGIGLDFLVCAT